MPHSVSPSHYLKAQTYIPPRWPYMYVMLVAVRCNQSSYTKHCIEAYTHSTCLYVMLIPHVFLTQHVALRHTHTALACM